MPSPLASGVAIFDEFPDEREMLAVALSQCDIRVTPVPFDSFHPDPAALAAHLRASYVPVVIWDVSPPLFGECEAFRALQRAGAFGDCAVILTTTHEPQLRARLDCGLMPVFLKPYDVEALIAAVTRLQRRDTRGDAIERPRG